MGLGVVLAIFLGGISFGSIIFGFLANKWNGKNLYSLLVFSCSILGFLTVYLYKIYNKIPFLFYFFSFLLAIFIGGTLPAIIEYVSKFIKNISYFLGILYGFNTLGAALSALLSILLFFPNYSLFVVAIISSLLYILAYLLTFFAKKHNLKDKIYKEKFIKKEFPSFSSVFIFFITGIFSICLEILWTRQFSVTFGNSIYTFSFILFVYLLGLFSGSYYYSFVSKKKEQPLKDFLFSIFLCNVFMLLTLPLWDEIPIIQIEFLKIFGVSFLNFHLVNLIISFIYIFIPTFLMGYSYPAFISYFCGKDSNISLRSGFSIGFNGIGNVVGSLITPLIFLPFFGVRKSVIIISFIISISILIITIINFKKKLILILPLLILSYLISFIPWDNEKWFTGLAKMPYQVIEGVKKSSLSDLYNSQEVLEVKDDREISIAILRKKETNNKVLMIQGKPDASDSFLDKYTEILVGVISFFYNPNAKDIYCLGFGSGITSNSILNKKNVNLITAEISPKVIELAKDYFFEENKLTWQSSNHQIIIGDGRKILKKMNKKFDLIISQPSNPWVAGMSSLFTLEFFQEVKEKLKENGIFCQWFHLYGMSMESFYSFAKTFLSVFSDADMYILPLQGDIILISSKGKLEMPYNSYSEFNEELKTLLSKLNIYNNYSLYAYYQGKISHYFKDYKDIPLNTDYFTYLEYKTPKDLFKIRSTKTLEEFIKFDSERNFYIDISLNSGISSKKEKVKERFITTCYFKNMTTTSFLKEVYENYEIWTSLNDPALSKEEGLEFLKYFYRDREYIKIVPILWENKIEKAVLGKKGDNIKGYFYIDNKKFNKSHFIIAECKKDCEKNYQFLIDIIQNLVIF
jgi:spermidine synthase